MPKPKIAVHGHRGARAALPENTLPAFRYAIEAGADYIELDLAVTGDDVLVVSHDAVLNETICTAPRGSKRVIRESTLAELRRWDCGTRANPLFPGQATVPGAQIPTLDEVLELGRGNSIQFNIEVKSDPAKPRYTPPPERFAGLIVEALRRKGMENRAIVQSFDFRITREVAKQAPSVRLAALFFRPKSDFVAMANEACAGIAAPYFRLVRPGRVRASHDAGIEVVPWTVNKKRQWEAMLRAGVDGIITDDPAGLIRFLGAA